jgi:hypothetical protein
MNANRMRYQAFMLRLWQVRVGDEPVWRASLEIPGVEGRQGFSDLESLFEYLLEQTQGRPVEAAKENTHQGEA